MLTEVTTELDRRAVPVSLFLRPRAVPASRALARWVRSRLADGDDVLIHGYGDPPTRSLLGRRPEFAGLPAHEAGLRISAAIAALERAGLRVPDIAGFAPPGWIASDGTLDALRTCGLLLCADGARIHDLCTGTVHKAKVHALGGGGSDRAETVRCFAVLLAVARAANRGAIIRLHIDATQAGRSGPRQALLDAVDVALEAGAVPQTYRQLDVARIGRARGLVQPGRAEPAA